MERVLNKTEEAMYRSFPVDRSGKNYINLSREGLIHQYMDEARQEFGARTSENVRVMRNRSRKGRYDSKMCIRDRLGTAAPKTGARLPEVIEKRRSDMASQGMILPLVGYADDERLAPNQFLVTVALQTVTGDIRKDILFDMVVDMIKAVQIQDPSKKGVRALLVEAVNNLVEKNYQESMDCFRKVSYWGSIIGGCEADCVRATLCYGARCV